MRRRNVVLTALLLGAPCGSLISQQPALQFDRLVPGQLEAYVDGILTNARRSLDRLLAMSGPRTVANTLRPYDDFRIALNAARVVSLLRTQHPDSLIRVSATRAETSLASFNRAWRADPRVPAMLAAVDTSSADSEVRYWLRRELEAFRRDYGRDPAARARVVALRAELDGLEQRWDENLRYDTVTVAFDSAALVGMRPEWLAGRARGPGGTLLVGDQELRTVATDAMNPATRERALVLSWRPRRNQYLLDTLLRARAALASELGERSWASYQLRDAMAGSPERVRAFLDEVRRVTAPGVRRTIEQRAAPGSTSILLSDFMYAAPDSAAGPGRPETALRPYLPYPRVRDGMLELARDLLGLEFRPAPDLPVWEPTVEPYRVFEHDSLIGRVYLDVHFRSGKSIRGASTANFRLGVRGRAITEAAIIAGMVRSRPGETPLLGPQPMGTLFHEFGHLLHNLLSVRDWFATSGLPTEFDFREVPSVLFEEWARDPAVLARFARHYQTGEPPPPALLELLRRAGPTNEALAAVQSEWVSRFSLELHDRPPGNITAIVRQTFLDNQPPGLPVQIRLPQGDLHPEVALPHLGNYGPSYYTYLWDQAIARDLLSRFEHGLLDTAAVHAYRRAILEPGRSRPALELIEGFLGRPLSLDAWVRSLSRPEP
ncbi:MAG TPA: M3 family metallopeptidase [Gemmatimonadales bacterium]|nr:M3 family metallopeptidase [Gemmatimonadales bacterium]